MNFTGYDLKKDVIEKMILNEEEMLKADNLKETLIYSQILNDLETESFKDWITEQLLWNEKEEKDSMFEEETKDKKD